MVHPKLYIVGTQVTTNEPKDMTSNSSHRVQPHHMVVCFVMMLSDCCIMMRLLQSPCLQEVSI